MAVAPGELQPNGWLPVDPITFNSIPWAEAIGKAGTLSDGQFAYEGGCQFVVPLYFYWTDLAKAIPAILGTNTFDGTNLNRVPPIQHPLFPQMYASRITGIHGLQFTGKTRKLSQNVAASPVASTKLVMLTVLFEQPPYDILDDITLDTKYPPYAGIRNEWMRFVEKGLEPAGEVISREGGSFEYVEGAPNGKPFTQTQGQSLLKPQ